MRSLSAASGAGRAKGVFVQRRSTGLASRLEAVLRGSGGFSVFVPRRNGTGRSIGVRVLCGPAIRLRVGPVGPVSGGAAWSR